MKEESHNPGIDPELEARIVALVLGEASDFEREHLDRLVKERPELAAFKEQMQSMHGLLGIVATDDSVADDCDWTLPAEKRDALLALISGDAAEQPTVRFVSKPVEQRSSVKGSLLWKFTKIAAVFFFAAGSVGSIGVSQWLSSRTSHTADSRQLASNENAVAAAMDGSMSTWDDDTSLPREPIVMDAATTFEAEVQGLPAEFEGFDGERDSKSALSAIRDSLDLYSIASADGENGPEPAQQPADRPADIALGIRVSEIDLPTQALGLQRPFYATPEREKFQQPEAAGESRYAREARTRLSDVTDQYGENGQQGDAAGLAADAFAAPKSGEGQASSQGHPQLFGGTALSFSDGLEDSRTAGQEMDAKGAVANDKKLGDHGYGMGGGGMGGGVAADGFKNGISSKRKREEIAEREPASSLRFGELSQPLITELDSGVEAYEAEESSDYAAFDANGSGAEIPAYSVPNHSAWPTAPEEDARKKAKLAAPRRFENELAKESVAMPSDDDIALNFGRNFDREYFLRQPTSERVTGTARGQRRGDLQAEQPTLDGGWRYRARLNYFEGKSSELGESDEQTLSEEYRGKADETWEELPPDSSGKQVELLRRSDRWAAEVRAAVVPAGEYPAGDGRDRWYGYEPPMLEDRPQSIKKALAKKSAATAGLNEKSAEDESFSTFSLHVSDVSFKLAQAALAQGEWPEAAKVRIEEFVNAFDYGDPMPSQEEKVACLVEQSTHPFLQQRNLMRVSMRTAAAGRSSNTPLRLTLLLDNSGSMERSDRQRTVRRAFALLAEQLKPIDQVTLISFARQPRLLADKVSGSQSAQLVQLINELPSEGGTNIESALRLAFEKAREQQLDNAQNRIILLTDGAVNLGDADPENLSRMITTMRDAGIAFDAAGISAEGLNDEILEALTRRGDGRYYLLDSLESADDGFARQLAGALRPSAKNVKVQVEFNPKRVGRYKLLGFEQHRLNQEDFRNDTVDAAEMTAAEAGVAVYQFEAKPDGEGDVGLVSVRFRDLSTGQMIENRWPIPYETDAPRPDQAAPSLRIATSAALLAAKLRGEPLGESVDLQTLSHLISGLPDQVRNANRVQQLQLMIQQARQVSGN
jgi:Mg-chelatase subunit ChlD